MSNLFIVHLLKLSPFLFCSRLLIPPLNGNLCFSSLESETCFAAQTSSFVTLNLTILSARRGSLLPPPPHLSLLIAHSGAFSSPCKIGYILVVYFVNKLIRFI